MVAIFVALMFIGFVTLDLIVQKVEARRAVPAASVAEAVRFEDWITAPEGVYFSEGHAWARPLQDGVLRAGVDSLVARALGSVSRVLLPAPGTRVEAGNTLFQLELNGRSVAVPCPVSGRVSSVNTRLQTRPHLVAQDPYGQGWVCALEKLSPGPALAGLRLGPRAALWLERELARFREFMAARWTLDSALGVTSQDGGSPVPGLLGQCDAAVWAAFEREFLGKR